MINISIERYSVVSRPGALILILSVGMTIYGVLIGYKQQSISTAWCTIHSARDAFKILKERRDVNWTEEATEIIEEDIDAQWPWPWSCR